ARQELAVRALVLGAQRASAVFDRTGDPTEAGVELARLPVLGRPDLLGLLLGRLLVEDADTIRAFAPDELLLGARLGVGVEKPLRFDPEAVQCARAHPPLRGTAALDGLVNSFRRAS